MYTNITKSSLTGFRYWLFYNIRYQRRISSYKLTIFPVTAVQVIIIHQNVICLKQVSNLWNFKGEKKGISHLPSNLPNCIKKLCSLTQTQQKYSLTAVSIPWKVSNHLTIAHSRHNSYVCLWWKNQESEFSEK